MTYRPLEAYVGGGLFYLAINLCLAGSARSPSGGWRRAGGAMNLDVLWRYAPSLAQRLRRHHPVLGRGRRARARPRLRDRACCAALRIPPLRWLLRAFIEVFRGTPFLVQLFLLYAGGPYDRPEAQRDRGRRSRPRPLSSAYFAEIFRAGFAAVPRRPDRGGDQRRHGARSTRCCASRCRAR